MFHNKDYESSVPDVESLASIFTGLSCQADLISKMLEVGRDAEEEESRRAEKAAEKEASA